MARLPPNETVVFQDEVDVHLNAKIGSCWMRGGEQAEVVTPGNNEKRHLAGSLHWRTGRLVLSPPGNRRNAALFVAHLDDLRRWLRTYRVIHVVCDNARFHDCRAVQEYPQRHPESRGVDIRRQLCSIPFHRELKAKFFTYDCPRLAHIMDFDPELKKPAFNKC